MGTHPIFESDFDCLTEMRFSQVLARAARTEYRTPVMKHPYQPGSTFGLLSPATPAYLFAGGCIFATVVELAYQSHQIMEGAVARSSIARRIELGREPDLDSIDHCGGKWYPLNVTRRSRLMAYRICHSSSNVGS